MGGAASSGAANSLRVAAGMNSPGTQKQGGQVAAGQVMSSLRSMASESQGANSKEHKSAVSMASVMG